MRVAVFTPSHRPRYLADCHRSLRSQTFADWEWIVVLNGGATWRPAEPDGRVRVIRAPTRVRGIGALKRFACEQTDADVLVELDHDDMLTPDCLAEVVRALEQNPVAALVYSDFSQIDGDGSPNHDRFDPASGWVYSDEDIGEATYSRCHALEPFPHNVSYIWYAPNHVRAFPRWAYDKVGGYDADLDILDDQDLMIRLYQAGDFVRLDRLLYLQRVHAANTQSVPAVNARIQERTASLRDGHIRSLAATWAARRGLIAGRLVVDDPSGVMAADEETVKMDPSEPVLPWPDGSVGLLKLIDVLQHVGDRASLFNECHRVLHHGGLLFTQTPSTDGRGAFQDPLAVSYWNENSFWYLTQSGLHASLPELRARLQVSRLHTGYPSAWHEQHHIPYVYADLLAIKDGPRQGGPLLS